MSLYYMSCIICLNEIYFICVLARKLGSISRGLWPSWDSHTQRWTYHLLRQGSSWLCHRGS